MIAIGDIHGQYTALKELISRLPKEELLIFLGDYTDRGPDSYEVIEYLIELGAERACIFLKGNHDDFFLDEIKGIPTGLFYANGGGATHDSYSKQGYGAETICTIYGGTSTGKFYAPETHIKFLENLQYSYETDNFFFVHAGVNPYLENPIAETSFEDMLWIRNQFLSDNDTDYGKKIIHGHTPAYPTFNIEVTSNRINLDTGAGYFKRLSAINPETKKVWQVEIVC